MFSTGSTRPCVCKDNLPSESILANPPPLLLLLLLLACWSLFRWMSAPKESGFSSPTPSLTIASSPLTIAVLFSPPLLSLTDRSRRCGVASAMPLLLTLTPSMCSLDCLDGEDFLSEKTWEGEREALDILCPLLAQGCFNPAREAVPGDVAGSTRSFILGMKFSVRSSHVIAV